MPGRIWTGEEKYNIIMESFQNPNITIAEICRNHGIAVSMFYKWKDQFLEGERKGLEGKDLDEDSVVWPINNLDSYEKEYINIVEYYYSINRGAL